MRLALHSCSVPPHTERTAVLPRDHIRIEVGSDESLDPFAKPWLVGNVKIDGNRVLPSRRHLDVTVCERTM